MRTWKIIAVGVGIMILFGAIAVWQYRTLQIAHSTFDNYYAFRGCTELIERTNTYGTCVTSSGRTIKIVEYGGRWFLDGDLPCKNHICW